MCLPYLVIYTSLYVRHIRQYSLRCVYQLYEKISN